MPNTHIYSHTPNQLKTPKRCVYLSSTPSRNCSARTDVSSAQQVFARPLTLTKIIVKYESTTRCATSLFSHFARSAEHPPKRGATTKYKYITPNVASSAACRLFDHSKLFKRASTVHLPAVSRPTLRGRARLEHEIMFKY